MLDCGFGLREAESRLTRLGVAPSDLSAIIVTHEHHDHVGGVFKVARRHRLPVWLTYGTFQAIRHKCKDVVCHICRDGEQFAVGDLQFSPYTVPHDAREPVQYTATDGVYKLGILTDAGQSTPHLVRALDACHALMLECNHDRELLANSDYPPSLKHRIGGPYGHLSNDASAEILSALDNSRLRRVVGAHLSVQNNTPALARAALRDALGGHEAEVGIACQQGGFGWVGLND